MKKVRMFGMLCFLLLPFLFSCNNENPKPNKPSIEESKLLLKFGDKVTCVDKESKAVTTGKEVKAGENYIFTAKLGQDEELDAWYVNTTKQQDERATTFDYTVDAAHGVQESGSENKVITIKFELMSGKLIIKFNDKVVCQDSKNETKGSPVEVKVDEEFKFTPIPSVGKKLKNWTVNGTEKSGATAEEFSYKVVESDAQTKGTNKVITIGFTEVDKQKVKIKFDNTVTCTKLGASPEVNSEDSVFEGEVLTFTALQIKDTEFVHEWLKNDAKFEKKCGSEIDYKVDINDAKQDGDAKSITIKFNKREAKMVVIKFDESKIECDDESIKSGAEVKEGTKFTFTPKDESLENIFWYINDTKYTTEKDPNFIYVANDADAKDDNSKRLIEISYKDN